MVLSKAPFRRAIASCVREMPPRRLISTSIGFTDGHLVRGLLGDEGAVREEPDDEAQRTRVLRQLEPVAAQEDLAPGECEEEAPLLRQLAEDAFQSAVSSAPIFLSGTESR